MRMGLARTRSCASRARHARAAERVACDARRAIPCASRTHRGRLHSRRARKFSGAFPERKTSSGLAFVMTGKINNMAEISWRQKRQCFRYFRCCSNPGRSSVMCVCSRVARTRVTCACDPASLGKVKNTENNENTPGVNAKDGQLYRPGKAIRRIAGFFAGGPVGPRPRLIILGGRGAIRRGLVVGFPFRLSATHHRAS